MHIKINTIEQLRGAKGITYEKMDKHISRGTYHGIAFKGKDPSDSSMKKLTQVFNVSKEDIIGLLKNNKG